MKYMCGSGIQWSKTMLKPSPIAQIDVALICVFGEIDNCVCFCSLSNQMTLFFHWKPHTTNDYFWQNPMHTTQKYLTKSMYRQTKTEIKTKTKTSHSKRRARKKRCSQIVPHTYLASVKISIFTIDQITRRKKKCAKKMLTRTILSKQQMRCSWFALIVWPWSSYRLFYLSKRTNKLNVSFGSVLLLNIILVYISCSATFPQS